jgi:hypothetical protein
VLAALAPAAGCGGDDADDGPNPVRDPGSSTPAADYARAEAEMERDDYDTAIPLMEELGDYRDATRRAMEFRVEAAEETLANARTKLRLAPRAALSLAQTAQRYNPTPEGEAFVARARVAHERFKRRGEDDDQEG